MSGILSLIFGESGKMADIFGGSTFIIAFFILIFFLLMLLSRKTSGENMVLFTFIFLLLIISEGLFNIPQQYLIVPIILIVLFIGNYVYNYFNKND